MKKVSDRTVFEIRSQQFM